MCLSNSAKLARFRARRATPASSSRGLNSSGERLYSYNLELARHCVAVGGGPDGVRRVLTDERYAGVGTDSVTPSSDTVVMLRDRCESTSTTKRHYHDVRYSSSRVLVAPQHYPDRAWTRRGAGPLVIPVAEFNDSGAQLSIDELWAMWLDKLEAEHGKAARKYAARRIKRLRHRLEIKQLIDAL